MANRDMRHGCNSESFGLESKNQRSVDHSQPIGGQYSGEIKQEAASSSCSSDEDHIPKTIESTNQRSLNHSRPMRGQYPDHVISLNQSEDRSLELANEIPQTVTSHQNHRGRDSKLNRWIDQTYTINVREFEVTLRVWGLQKYVNSLVSNFPVYMNSSSQGSVGLI